MSMFSFLQVGLKSCQEMVECTDRIWEAGRSPANKHPNPYPFTSSSKQGVSEITAMQNAPWNLNLALGKLVIESSAEDKHGPYLAVDGKDDTYWISQFETSPWITIDLGRSYALKEIKVTYVPNLFSPFPLPLQISDELKDIDSAPLVFPDFFTGQISSIGRYVRILCSFTPMPTPIQCGIKDVQIFSSTSFSSIW